ncbi:diguanylate cyclase/phosphodiesterase (GGDEF & EAL domains) with PAS/PAC sensor(s) [hydrothermal vent metagenome]|uniref:Diguanylate cyclase/phosphodiesterase (GGDEF & EAL domains) with PAS/PAC sensor(S) n=1 Tax=hydrothermal vent metagenome TaxID=652676 RepID=A0A3B0XJY2_9ZZZZ
MSGLENFKMAERKTPLLLVVDDDIVIRSMLTKALQKQGYDFIEALNGVEGIELFRQHRPDLVLLDVLMPVMNGFEACQAMREQDPERSVPIIMLTGLDDVTSVDKAFDSGATDFITKPINWSLFSQRVRYALKSREVDFELRKSRHRVDHALKVAMLGYWDWDLHTNEFSIPAGVLDMLGIDRNHIKTFDDLISYVPDEDRDRVVHAFDDARMLGTRFVLEHRMQGMDHKERYVYQQCEVIMGDDKKPGYVLGTIQDITALKRAEDMILHQAYHDLLTDLPNQTLFKERLTHAIKVAEHAHHQVAVVAMDIDRFQLINESLGHEIGNELLLAFAGFLRGNVLEGDTVARISGNEFAVLLESPSSTEEIRSVLSGLNQALKANTFELANQKVTVSLSLGVAVYPADDVDAGGLIQCANAAMRKAKSQGGDQEYFYTHDMNRRVDDRLRMESDLRTAIENEDLELFYQPQVESSSRKIIASEALVRWRHKEHGLVPPIRFIPLAEETGLIHPLGRYVLEQAIKQTRQWNLQGHPLSVGINLSARQFMQVDLVGQIKNLISLYSIDPQHIDLEITETIVMQDADSSINKMHQLKELGVTLSMDDFGTGYSSLSYLHQFPLDVLKIDRSFVKDITGNEGDGAIARAVIAMAHSMKLKVIAEGVETEEQYAFLSSHGCEVIQGYLISRPVPAGEFEELL